MKLSDCKTIDELKKFLGRQTLYYNANGEVRHALPCEVHVDFDGQKFRAFLTQGCYLDELYDTEHEACNFPIRVWIVRLHFEQNHWVLDELEGKNYSPNLDMVFCPTKNGISEFFGYVDDRKKIPEMAAQLKKACVCHLEKRRRKLADQIREINNLKLL